jgi:tRNA(Ile)-lysidine synthase
VTAATEALRAFEIDGSVAIALSGGADSTALLHAAREVYGSARTVAIHINHGIRPSSGDDAQFCADLAQGLGVRHEAITLALGPDAGEHLARQARYHALGDACARLGANTLLTAHHADDNLETLLLALCRGSGLVGMAGIRERLALKSITGTPEHQAALLRPWLSLSKRDIADYLAPRPHVVDPTNRLRDRRRNRIRHEVLPILKEIADSVDPMYRTTAVLREDRDLIEDIANDALSGARATNGYSLPALRALPRPLLAHTLRLAIVRRTGGPPPDAAAIARAVDLVIGPSTGKSLDFPGTRMRVTRDTVELTDDTAREPPAAPDSAILQVPGHLEWGDASVTAQWCTGDLVTFCPGREFFDASRLRTPLHVRPHGQGERLTRFAGGTKRISRLLIDAGVPRHRRNSVPVVTDDDGVLLWVAHVGRSSVAPIHPDCVRALMLEIKHR